MGKEDFSDPGAGLEILRRRLSRRPAQSDAMELLEQADALLQAISSYVAVHGSMPWVSSYERLKRQLLDMAYEGYSRHEYGYSHYVSVNRAIQDLFYDS